MAIKIGSGAGTAPTGEKPVKAPKEAKAPKEKKPKVDRKAKVQAIVDAGKPFTFVEKRKVQDFECICGSHGQNAIVMKDKNGKEVLAGESCAAKCGVTTPKTRARANVSL